MSYARADLGALRPSLHGAPLAWRSAWLTMDSNAAARAFAARPVGIAAVHALFGAALAATGHFSVAAFSLVCAALGAAAVLPGRRIGILVGASLAFFLLRPWRNEGHQALARALLDGLAWDGSPLVPHLAVTLGFVAFARGVLALQASGVGVLARRPVLVLILAYGAALAAMLTVPARGLTHSLGWYFVAVWGSSFWLLAYAMADQKARDRSPPLARSAYMRPFWGGEPAPIGKGLSFLRRFEAQDPDALARSRLKALKLIVWAALLSAALRLFTWGVHDLAAVPRLGDLILDPSLRAGTPVLMGWAAVAANFVVDLLILSVLGHVIVAIIRMVGFCIPRNTVNPLTSRSLAEFWNRYYFYVKELLVDLFFYPAFVRHFKSIPKIRVAFATFCAAGVGNFIYHVIQEAYVFPFATLADATPRFLTLAFYVSLLTVALVASQWRARKPRPEDGFLRYEIVPRLTVIGFFCVLKIFDARWAEGSLGDRFAFIAALFGVTS